jgi:Recombination endonuclease VII
VSRLIAEAERRGIRAPTPATLRRYGLTADEWLGLLKAQGWKCPVCLKTTGVRWVTDHRHVPGWRNMPPEQRKRFVRGICCSFCNHRRVHSYLTATQAQRIADYFKKAEERDW